MNHNCTRFARAFFLTLELMMPAFDGPNISNGGWGRGGGVPGRHRAGCFHHNCGPQIQGRELK
jgi:hypothetical protein